MSSCPYCGDQHLFHSSQIFRVPQCPGRPGLWEWPAFLIVSEHRMEEWKSGAGLEYTLAQADKRDVSWTGTDWGEPGGPDCVRNFTCRSRRSAAPQFQDCTVTATRTLWIRCRSSAAVPTLYSDSDRGRVQITARQLASDVQRCWRDQWRSRSTQSLAPIVARLSGCSGCGADSGLLISCTWSYLGARQRVSELLHCILWRGRGTSVCCRRVR